MFNTPVAPESPWRIQSLRAFRRARIIECKGWCVNGFVGLGLVASVGCWIVWLVGRRRGWLVGR